MAHVKRYELVKMFHMVNKSSKGWYWVTNCLVMGMTNQRGMQAIFVIELHMVVTHLSFRR